jgi:hypothetical protein
VKNLAIITLPDKTVLNNPVRALLGWKDWLPSVKVHF